MAEIETEFQAIAKTGLREILILTGESRHQSSLEYIGEAVSLAKQYFSTIGIEIYPLNTDEYAFLQKKGADFVSVYQETYHPETYDQVHLSGPKMCIRDSPSTAHNGVADRYSIKAFILYHEQPIKSRGLLFCAHFQEVSL